MRYLGLDLGTRTLGLSISDRSLTIASPLITLRFKEGNYEGLIKELDDYVKKYDVKAFVLGYPKNMDNSEGFASVRSNNFKKLLENNYDIPVYLVDERLTTKESERILLEGDMSRRKRKQVIDNVASSIILQSFLERKKNEEGSNN